MKTFPYLLLLLLLILIPSAHGQAGTGVPTDKLGQKEALEKELFLTEDNRSKGVWKTAPTAADGGPVQVVVKLVIIHVYMVGANLGRMISRLLCCGPTDYGQLFFQDEEAAALRTNGIILMVSERFPDTKSG